MQIILYLQPDFLNILNSVNTFRKLSKLSGTGFSHGQYYESMNHALKRLNNEFTMLHYPLYVNESDSFLQAQKNLTDYCISLLEPMENKNILEIGCGNGVQTLYINDQCKPLHVTGIDLSEANIKIANQERELSGAGNVNFLVDDAQNLKSIPSESIDVLLNIESAFHYPDKSAFLKEVSRVLKPNGQYLIADILIRRKKSKGIMKMWGKKMIYHFWDLNLYEKGFEENNLVKSYFEDISNQVIKGWSIYRNWLPPVKIKTFFSDFAFRLFYSINARMNVLLLRRRQQYCIYVGYKPELPNKLH
jgi:ubiquinone/menaquinone biosynthesis C-methylase UbiE